MTRHPEFEVPPFFARSTPAVPFPKEGLTGNFQFRPSGAALRSRVGKPPSIKSHTGGRLGVRAGRVRRWRGFFPVHAIVTAPPSCITAFRRKSHAGRVDIVVCLQGSPRPGLTRLFARPIFPHRLSSPRRQGPPLSFVSVTQQVSKITTTSEMGCAVEQAAGGPFPVGWRRPPPAEFPLPAGSTRGGSNGGGRKIPPEAFGNSGSPPKIRDRRRVCRRNASGERQHTSSKKSIWCSHPATPFRGRLDTVCGGGGE